MNGAVHKCMLVKVTTLPVMQGFLPFQEELIACKQKLACCAERGVRGVGSTWRPEQPVCAWLS